MKIYQWKSINEGNLFNNSTGSQKQMLPPPPNIFLICMCISLLVCLYSSDWKMILRFDRVAYLGGHQRVAQGMLKGTVVAAVEFAEFVARVAAAGQPVAVTAVCCFCFCQRCPASVETAEWHLAGVAHSVLVGCVLEVSAAVFRKKKN